MPLGSSFAALADRRRRVKVYAQAAAELGLNYALTLSPDIYPEPGEDAHALINSISRDVFRELAIELARRDGRHLSQREAKRTATLDFLGLYEFRDRRGLRYPHAHLAIKLDDDRDQPFWASAFFMERFGLMEIDDRAAAPTPTHYPPTGTPVCRRLGAQSHAVLEPIYGMHGWMGYLSKNADDTSELVLPGQFKKLVGGHALAA
jgi:hypothetical protein